MAWRGSGRCGSEEDGAGSSQGEAAEVQRRAAGGGSGRRAQRRWSKDREARGAGDGRRSGWVAARSGSRGPDLGRLLAGPASYCWAAQGGAQVSFSFYLFLFF